MPVALVIVVFILAIAFGSLSGFISSKVFGGKMTKTTQNETSETKTDGAGSLTSAGVKNSETFTDSAEGTLKKGGFEGEGSFHLERPGGESQNVYLTSSTVDLSQFEGKNVMVLGKTFAAEKAGWLMDVGYIEVK